jgi:hypothetical protein
LVLIEAISASPFLGLRQAFWPIVTVVFSKPGPRRLHHRGTAMKKT